MPSKYESQDGKINNFISKFILPYLENKDLDYNETVKSISNELGVSVERVKRVIENFITLGKIQENHFLVFPDNQIEDLIKKVKQKEQELKLELSELEVHKTNTDERGLNDEEHDRNRTETE